MIAADNCQKLSKYESKRYNLKFHAMLDDLTNDRKEWKIERKKIEEHKRFAFALVYGQLSDSSRCEVQDHEDCDEGFLDRDLLYLIQQIRGTHIARQSGNPRQDMERVRTIWATMRMQPHETSIAFRKRVVDYQLERASVGLEQIPDEELVIGILNRLDMSRYAGLVRDYLDNERRAYQTYRKRHQRYGKKSHVLNHVLNHKKLLFSLNVKNDSLHYADKIKKYESTYAAKIMKYK